MTAIDDKYQELGGPGGWLGPPQTDELPCPDGVGRYRHYANGSIYWAPQPGAHEVHGAIRDEWSQLGWERSFLGYPLTDETGTPDGIGRFNHFQEGSVYWTSATGAHEVHGAIRDKWAQLGWERSEFGYPTSDETSTPDRLARFSTFQHGEIYWIGDPNVSAPQTEYPWIRFQPSDKVTLDAGGCCQTGGAGATWKRYVDPSGPNADRLYHGLVWIPGAINNLQRIGGWIGRPSTVAAVPNPADLFLRLGYEDDDYSDNGYWGRDEGTENQCAGQPNAWVMCSVIHSASPVPAPAPAQMDLVWADTDDNLIPLNPKWGLQVTANQLPTAPTFPLRDSQVDLGDPPVTTQAPSPDTPTGFNAAVCYFGATGTLHGHLNWGPATYVGPISWSDHSSPGADDDYNMSLIPPGAAGLVTQNHGILHLEFDSDETIDHFGTPWWNAFHDAVDNDDAQAHQMVNSVFAIVTGLFGIDVEHNPHSELHPVWALAMRVKDEPNDETWAIFLRNWGDEGYCSSLTHRLYLVENRFTFRLPWRPNATSVTVNDGATKWTTNDPQQVIGPSIATDVGHSVLVTFAFPPPEAGALLDGELHLQWSQAAPSGGGPVVGPTSVARATAMFSAVVGPQEATRVLAARPQEPDQYSDCEKKIATAIARLPAEKQAILGQLRRRVPQTTAPGVPAQPLEPAEKVLQDAAVLSAGRIPIVRSEFDAAKAARDVQRHQILAQAFGGTLPLQVFPPDRIDRVNLPTGVKPISSRD